MPRVLSSAEIVARRASMPADHPRHVAAARRDGIRRGETGAAYPDPWLWDDVPATLAAYMAGWREGQTRRRFAGGRPAGFRSTGGPCGASGMDTRGI